MFSELCRETLRRAVAHGYLGYIISLRDQLAAEEDAEEEEEEFHDTTYYGKPYFSYSSANT